MKNFKIALILLTVFIISSCLYDKDENLDMFVPSPEISILSDSVKGANLIDSMKLSLNSNHAGRTYYNFAWEIPQIKGLDNSFSFSLENDGAIKMDGVFIKNNTLPLKGSFEYYPNNYGSHEIILTSDNGYKTSSKSIHLYCFQNLVPVAMYEIIKADNTSKLEYIIDASNSYDQDKKYGGGILKYRYIIEGLTYEKDIVSSPETANKLHVVFSQSGDHEIVVRVQDNNEQWSNSISEHVSVFKNQSSSINIIQKNQSYPLKSGGTVTIID